MDVEGEFLVALAPVIGGMLAGPRLSDASQDYRRTRAILRDLAFSEENVAAGRWWTQFSYAFVHKSDEHLVRNIFALVPFAHAVHTEFGALWLPIFMGGVWAGAQNVAGKRYQVARRISAPLSIRSWAPSLFEPAAEAMDKVTRQVATWLAPSVVRTTSFVGASAGVWALQGTALCLSIERIVIMLLRMNWSAPVRDDVIQCTRTWPHVLSVCVLSAQLVSTATSIKTGESSAIDHSGHLDGFLVGVGCYAALRFAQAVHQRRSRLPIVRGGVLLGSAR